VGEDQIRRGGLVLEPATPCLYFQKGETLVFKKIFIIITLSVATSAVYGSTDILPGRPCPDNTKNPQTLGGTTFYYGKNGAYLGSSQQYNGTTLFKDETGRFTGKSQTLGNSTFYNGQTGNYLGQSQKYNGSTMYFNQHGGFTGSSRP
jgi:hypothetical protein